MEWYAAFVETGREYEAKKSICKLVSDSSLKCLIPSRRVAERRQGRLEETMKPLFPGYVLVRTTMTTSIYRTLMNAPRVFKVLADEGSLWSRIPDDEMEPILQLLQDGEVIDYSHVFIQNSEVVVLSGPLCGMEHLIQKVNKRKGRVRVALTFDGMERTLDLGMVLVPPTGQGTGDECLVRNSGYGSTADLPQS